MLIFLFLTLHGPLHLRSTLNWHTGGISISYQHVFFKGAGIVSHFPQFLLLYVFACYFMLINLTLQKITFYLGVYYF